MSRSILISALVLAVVGVLACSSSRTLDPLDGTRPVGLPPVPPDLVSRVYSVDVFVGSGCTEVPSGLRNCQEILRREAARKLVQRLEQLVSAEFEDSSRTSANADAGYREDLSYLSVVTSSYYGRLSIRDHESPIFRIDSSSAYAMRVALVREEVDLFVWTEIAERADADGRPVMADTFRRMVEERYGSHTPDRDRIRDVEEDIARHFSSIWQTSDLSEREG